METLEIRALRDGDQGLVAATGGGPAWNPDRGLWDRYLRDAEEGLRAVLLALDGEGVQGYGTLDWHPDYPPFARAGIPEINNLVVAERARRRGIAARLIGHFEEIARSAGKPTIGIGVGLYADYGPAQRLYAKLGYLPDGLGITHGGAPVPPGAMVPADDDLILWLTKPL